MATTDVHSLPYPEATADARLGAADIQALAEALDERLSGALVTADVATEAIPDSTNDLLNLTIDDDETAGALFANSGALHIEYLGTPTVVATIYAQVTWEGDAAGTRRLRFLRNSVSFHTKRETPDADPITVSSAWPVLLSTGDIISLEVWQNSGGSLDVTAAQFKCVIAGVSPA